MTGTALTEATEFMKIYKLSVVEIPTNRNMVRRTSNDQVYKTKDGKWDAVSREIIERHANGQPVLVGTVSVEVSELLSEDAEEGRHQAHGAQRQARVRRARGRDRRRGGPARRRHDRDEHGRPRRRHQARRQPRAPHADRARQARPEARRPRLRRALQGHPAVDRASASRHDREKVLDGRRPVHRRHRAPRVAAHRQPAARPLRPPGRPGRVALLPLCRGRPRAPLRRRSHLQASSTASAPSTTRAARSRSRPRCCPSRSRRRRRRSRSRTSCSASACSSTTTS